MLLQKGKFYLSLLVAFVAGAIFATIFTKLLKWSVVLIVLAMIVAFVVVWVRFKFTRPNPKKETP